MIESVIEFRDTQVGQIMTPRPEIVAIEIAATLETMKAKIARRIGHSRIPVYRGDSSITSSAFYTRAIC